MTRRPLIALLAVLVVLASGLVWILRGVSTAPPSGAAVAAAPGDEPVQPLAKSSASGATSELATPIAPTSAAKVDADRAAVVAQPTDVSASELAEGTWVEGVVRFPEGTPMDEHVIVVADGRAFSGHKVHKAAVGRDGHFRVAFAKGTKKGWLRIEARYLFLDEAFSIKLDALPSEITLAPHVGGCLRGKLKPSAVALAQAKSLTGATVTAGGWHPNGHSMLERSAKVDDVLEFELGGLDADAHWTFGLSPKGFQSVQNHEFTPERGIVKTIDLDMPLGVHVTGRVTDENGAPLAKAGVAWEKGEIVFMPGSGQSERTKDDGTYEISGIPPGKVELHAHMEGFLDGRIEAFDGVDGDVKTGLDFALRRGNAVSGIVRWPDGKPAADVRVEIEDLTAQKDSRRMMDLLKPSASTKPDGTFTVTGLEAGPFKLTARSLPKEVEAKEASAPKAGAKRPAKARFTAELVDVKPNAPDSHALEIVLRSGASVSGRVVDDLGVALDAFTVRAVPSTRHFSVFSSEDVVKSFHDTQGEFELVGLADGEWDVYADTKKGLESSRHKISLPGENGRVDLVIPRPGKLSGFVLGPGGAAVAGALVHVDTDEHSFYMLGGDDPRSKKTDEKGAFAFDAVGSGKVVLHASADALADCDPVKLDLAPAQDVGAVTLLLRVGGTISGEVFDKDGKPHEGRRVNAWSQQSSGRNRDAVCDAAGHFRIEHVTPGDVQLSAQPTMEEMNKLRDKNGNYDWSSNEMPSKTVKVVDGTEIHVVLGGAPRNPVRVSGIVTCGKPIGDVEVSAYRREKGDDENGRWKQARTDEQGHYEMTLNDPGMYDFNVRTSSGSMATLEQDVPAGATFRLDFALPNGHILGRVVGESGTALEGIEVNVSVVQETGKGLRSGFGSAQTDAQGRFEFDALGAGTYSVSAREPDWRGNTKPKTHGGAQASDLVLAEGGKIDGIELRLPDAGVVTGVVLDAAGHPVSGAHVHLRPASGSADESSWRSYDSDASGRFRIDGVTPGSVTLVALTDTSTSRIAAATVRAHETSDVSLQLEPGSKLRIIVQHADGKAFQTWSQIVDDKGQNWSWLPHEFSGENADSSAVVGPLPAGNYTVSAQAGKDKKVQADVHLGASGEQAVTLRFTD